MSVLVNCPAVGTVLIGIQGVNLPATDFVGGIIILTIITSIRCARICAVGVRHFQKRPENTEFVANLARLPHQYLAAAIYRLH